MVDYIENIGINLFSAVFFYILQRYRDIFQDYFYEFQKIRINIIVLREREDFLGLVYRDIK